MESIIYTYKKPTFKILPKDSNQKEWIKKSINSVRGFGYNIELYTNDKSFSDGLDLYKVHYIDDDYEIWDSFKIHVLETRTDDYFLSDSDVLYKSKLPFDSSTDLYFDGIESHNWDWAYKPTMDYLKENDVFSDLPFWDYSEVGVFNIGILKINNQELKSKYIKYWKESYELIVPHFDKINKSSFTQILTQYLLTVLTLEGNFSNKHFTRNHGWPLNNDYYEHYPGHLKIKKRYTI